MSAPILQYDDYETHADRSAAMFEAGPVIRLDFKHGSGFMPYVATTRPVIQALEQRPDDFGRDRELHANFQAALEEVGQLHPLDAMFLLVFDTMLTSDGMQHSRIRGAFMQHFTVHHVKRNLVSVVNTAITDLLKEMRAGFEVHGKLDLKEAFASELPIRVTCGLIGVPMTQASELSRLSRLVFAGDPTAFGQMAAYVTQLIESKGPSPSGDSVLDRVIRDRTAGKNDLTDSELVSQVVQLVLGGFDTTMSAVLNVAIELITNPRWLSEIHAGTLSWEAVIAEILRHRSPVPYLPVTFATRNTELMGVSIPKGASIFRGYQAAHFDPEHYGPEPKIFNPHREEASKHIAFGVPGRHNCIGRQLALAELRAALPALFNAFPELAIVGELEEHPALMAQQPKELLIRQM